MNAITRPEDIGPTVRRMRVAAGLSQFALSERTGTTATHIGRIERGVTIPEVVTLVKLIEGCGGRLVVEGP